MSIFDDFTIKELIKDASSYGSDGECKYRKILFTFKVKNVIVSSCCHADTGVYMEQWLQALLYALARDKTHQIRFVADENCYLIYKHAEMIIFNAPAQTLKYHESAHQYAFDYKQGHGNFGDFKPMVEQLNDPPFEAWVMAKISRKNFDNLLPPD